MRRRTRSATLAAMSATPQEPTGKLRVVCPRCGESLAPLALVCPRCPDVLPRAEYAERRFLVRDLPGIFRFAAWLPPAATAHTPIGPVVLRNERLAAALGLADLSIAFSGYAPELGALNATGTFKDWEALPTLLYLRQHACDRVVLASAGSTARAFAYAATVLEFSTYIVVPEAVASSVWTPVPPSDHVRLIALAGSGDYAAAIRVSAQMAERYDLRPEGGARNIARRDGMGTALLEYARSEGRLPLHYVQAIGSGSGGIAVWEASMRLQAAGLSGPLPRLHLAQNAPFTPIHDAWTTGRPLDSDRDVPRQLERIAAISAPVLANRTPPYALGGGVRDALQTTGGHTYAATNGEIRAEQALFERYVGVPVGPEAGAALAALEQALARSWIRPAESVLLHATGNADSLSRYGVRPQTVPVWRRVDAAEPWRELDRAFAA